jgi:hypothetical protein
VTNSAGIFRNIYLLYVSKGGEIKCQIQEGIVFAFHNTWEDKESLDLDGSKGIDERTEGDSPDAYGKYANDRLKRPEFRRMKISLDRLARTIYMVESSWQQKNRRQAIGELENVLVRQHELEKEVEKIYDIFIRGYIYEKLDNIASSRRSLIEEIKWDIESEKNMPEKINKNYD